jgi:hypothetical protein
LLNGLPNQGQPFCIYYGFILLLAFVNPLTNTTYILSGSSANLQRVKQTKEQQLRIETYSITTLWRPKGSCGLSMKIFHIPKYQHLVAGLFYLAVWITPGLLENSFQGST